MKRENQKPDFPRMGISESRVIAYLAENPNVTPYKIEMDTKLAHSTVSYLLRGEDSLIERGFVDVVSQGSWRTGLNRRELRLSLKGLIFYFASMEVPSVDTNPDRTLAKKNRDIENKLEGDIDKHKDFHPIFKHWDALKEVIQFKKNVLCTHLFMLQDACNSTLQYRHFWNLGDVGVKVFNESYPLSTLGYDSALLFHFLGGLEGRTLIKKPVPAFYHDVKPILDKMEKMIVDVQAFTKAFI